MKNLKLNGLTHSIQSYRLSFVAIFKNFEPVVLKGVEVNVSETTRIDTVYFTN